MPAGMSGIVGPSAAPISGSGQLVRQGDRGEQIVALGRAHRAEQVQRGQMFSAFIPAAGQAPGTAIGTTACYTLALASGVASRLVIHKIMVGYISGTLGAGVLTLLGHIAVGSAIVAPTGGTAITPMNMSLGNATVSIANARFNNTVPASGLIIRAIAGLGASLASTAAAPWQVIDNVDGEIIVNPGQAVSVQGIAAGGSTPLITVGMIWAEEATA